MFSNLVLSGGGLGGITYFGCYKYICENSELKNNIKNILGASSGAIFSLFFIFDVSFNECIIFMDKLKHLNMKNIQLKSFLNLKHKFGLDNGDKMKDMIKIIYDIKNVRYNITFTEIAKQYGKNLIIATANVSQSKLFYFCVDNTPDVEVLNAIRASISIPFIFTPYIHNDDYHVDAFIYNNFPIEYFQKSYEHTIGLNLITQRKPIIGLFSFIQNIFDSMIHYNSSNKIKENECKLITQGNGFNIQNMSFDLNKNELEAHIDYGYETLKTFIENKITSLQRNSIDR